MNLPESLRVIDTNSADDSAGSVWGIEGSLLWVILGGLFLALFTLLVLFSGLAVPLGVALVVAAVPLVLSIGYVIHRQLHPPGYDRDLLDLWVNGRGFSPRQILEK